MPKESRLSKLKNARMKTGLDKDAGIKHLFEPIREDRKKENATIDQYNLIHTSKSAIDIMTQVKASNSGIYEELGGERFLLKLHRDYFEALAAYKKLISGVTFLPSVGLNFLDFNPIKATSPLSFASSFGSASNNELLSTPLPNFDFKSLLARKA